MARLIWSRRARDHLLKIRQFIANDSPRAAEALALRITQSTRRLERFPLSGRLVPEDPNQELREIIVGNYRVIYEVHGDDVEILGIRHGAQLLSDLSEL